MKFRVVPGRFPQKQFHYGPNGQDLMIEGNIYDSKDFPASIIDQWFAMRWIEEVKEVK